MSLLDKLKKNSTIKDSDILQKSKFFAEKDLINRRSTIHAVDRAEPEIPSFVSKNVEDTGPQPVVGSTFNATTASTPRRVVFDDTKSDELDVPDFLK